MAFLGIDIQILFPGIGKEPYAHNGDTGFPSMYPQLDLGTSHLLWFGHRSPDVQNIGVFVLPTPIFAPLGRPCAFAWRLAVWPVSSFCRMVMLRFLQMTMGRMVNV